VDLLDLILLVMIAAFAVAGYRQGFIVGVLSLAGFIGGVAAGALIAPPISHGITSSQSWQALIAVLVVFMAAVIGMLVASAIGVVVRSRVTARPAAVIDSLGGALVNVVALLVVAWLIASFVDYAPSFQAISNQVNRSLVLRTVDRIMPGAALDLPVFPPLRTLLSNGVYEQIFSQIGAQAAPDIPAPSGDAPALPALTAAYPSIVKVKGDAPSCDDTIEGSGFVISPDHVLTNAHVVAGVTRGLHVFTETGREYGSVTVVLYDSDTDIAVLYVPHLSASPLQFAGPAAEDTRAVVAGYPENGALTPEAAVIGRSFAAYGPNIYDTHNVTRQIYPIKADVEPGNSGGPLLSLSGTVYGVVFAKSTEYGGVGYALTASQVSSDAAKGGRRFSRTLTGGCQAG
jgi:S1-C subfamily serine protease